MMKTKKNENEKKKIKFEIINENVKKLQLTCDFDD